MYCEHNSTHLNASIGKLCELAYLRELDWERRHGGGVQRGNLIKFGAGANTFLENSGACWR